MADNRPIIGGPDRKVDGNRANCGGVCTPKPLEDRGPVGPKGIGDRGPGLHGTNYGTAGTQGKR